MSRTIQEWKKSIAMPWVIAGGGVYLFTLLALVYWFILPLRTHYNDLQNNQDGLENTYINLIQLDIETAIDSVDNHLGRLDQFKQVFENRLLKEPNLNAMMPVLDTYCTKAHLKVQTLEPLNKVQAFGENYQKLFARVSLQGTYADFLGWLQKLDSNPQWILIEKLSIEPTENPVRQTFTLELSVLRERSKT